MSRSISSFDKQHPPPKSHQKHRWPSFLHWRTPNHRSCRTLLGRRHSNARCSNRCAKLSGSALRTNLHSSWCSMSRSRQRVARKERGGMHAGHVRRCLRKMQDDDRTTAPRRKLPVTDAPMRRLDLRFDRSIDCFSRGARGVPGLGTLRQIFSSRVAEVAMPCSGLEHQKTAAIPQRTSVKRCQMPPENWWVSRNNEADVKPIPCVCFPRNDVD